MLGQSISSSLNPIRGKHISPSRMVAAACQRYLPNSRFHAALLIKTSDAWNVGISLSWRLPAPLGCDAVRGIFNQSSATLSRFDGRGTGNPTPGAKSAMPVKQMNEVQQGESDGAWWRVWDDERGVVLAEVSAGDGAECRVQECSSTEGVDVGVHGRWVGEPVQYGSACRSWRAGAERGEKGSVQRGESFRRGVGCKVWGEVGVEGEVVPGNHVNVNEEGAV
eukprot:3430503-Rhodomonas_salina.1